MEKEPSMSNTETQAAALTGGHEFDGFLGKAFEEKPIWTALYESLRDVFFPVKLPPLELTSTPIPVPDRMAVKPNPWAIGIAGMVNLLILATLLFFGVRKIIEETKGPTLATPIDISSWQPKAPKGSDSNGGGGGGGEHSIVDPIKGRTPKIEKVPIAPPQVETVDKPKLSVVPAIMVQPNIQLPDTNLPNLGVTKSANVTVLSGGQGSGSGIGTGSGGGDGSGNGNGFGPGNNGGAGGGLYHVGNGVSAPQALNSVEAEFSDEARRAKYQGVVLITLIVDAQGNPQNPRVSRPLGMGLDEKAIEAVKKYKFKPAMKDGHIPVPVMITVEVNFRLY
jgi:protein TonB